MIDKLTANTNIDTSVFGNLELTDSTKIYLKSMPFNMKSWQIDYIKSDTETPIYKNPVKELLDSANTIITSIAGYIPETVFDSAILALKNFRRHTDNMSGVTRAQHPKDNNYPDPDLNSALSVGQQTLSLMYNTSGIPAILYQDKIYKGDLGQSYEQIMAINDIPRYSIDNGIIVDNVNTTIKCGYFTTEFVSEKDFNNNLPMIGAFSSLYINDKISALLDKIKEDIPIEEITNPRLATPDSTILTQDVEDFIILLDKYRTSDITFYNNSMKLLKKASDVSRISNMGTTHSTLYEKIGTFNKLSDGSYGI